MTPTLLAIATAPHVRSEKDEQRLCDDFIARTTIVVPSIVRFSQPRNTMQTLGIPDRRYRAWGVPFWWECKAENGYLSAEQIEFLRTELHFGALGGVGTLDDLIAFTDPMRVRVDDWKHQLVVRARTLIERYTRPARRAKRGKL